MPESSSSRPPPSILTSADSGSMTPAKLLSKQTAVALSKVKPPRNTERRGGTVRLRLAEKAVAPADRGNIVCRRPGAVRSPPVRIRKRSASWLKFPPGHHVQAGCGQPDGERHPIEAIAELSDRLKIDSVTLKSLVTSRARALRTAPMHGCRHRRDRANAFSLGNPRFAAGR